MQSKKLTGVAVPLGALYTKENQAIGEFGDLVPSVCDMSVRFEENEHVRVIILKDDEYNKLKYDAD